MSVSSRKSVLVVDDDEATGRRIAEEIRGMMNSDVHVCASAREALSRLKKELFCLAILDLELGDDKNAGFDLAQTIRKKYGYCQVIIISVHSSLEQAQKAMRHGVFYFLSKPVLPAQLQETIVRASNINLPLHKINSAELKKIIAGFDEGFLTTRILCQLFNRMGFSDVNVHHGPHEHGKDIYFYDRDRFGDPEYYSVIVKAGAVDKQSNKPGNLIAIVTQAEEAFTVPLLLPNGQKVAISKLLIVVSGALSYQARVYLNEKISSYRIGMNLKILDLDSLVKLIKEYEVT